MIGGVPGFRIFHFFSNVCNDFLCSDFCDRINDSYSCHEKEKLTKLV